MIASEYFVIDSHGPATPATRARQVSSEFQWVDRYAKNIKARYDGAQTTIENERWWAQADRLSPRSATEKGVRVKLRSRSRYECIESNCYARGMVLTQVSDVIGTGASLQVTTENRDFNKLLEAEFNAWADEVDLAELVRTMFQAQIVDGEAFAERVTNRQLEHPVKLDLRLSEADLWTNFHYEHDQADREFDGIFYDASGNPRSYRRMKYHPGDNHWRTSLMDFDDLNARDVIHWYRKDRPDQKRGIPHFTPALPLFAELRRLILAVLSAYESAAELSGIMYSDANAFSDDPDEVDPNLFYELHRRALLTLPSGWKMSQLKAEHPTTQFEMFEEKILMQIARCLQMPLNIASGSSRKHNFASGRLDYILYWNANDVHRDQCKKRVLNRIFNWWLEEAVLIADYLPPMPTRLPHDWTFPRRRPIDEVAAAKARAIDWNLGLVTDEQYFAENSIDSTTHYEQLARQYELRESIHAHCPLPGIQLSESLMESDEPEEVPSDE